MLWWLESRRTNEATNQRSNQIAHPPRLTLMDFANSAFMLMSAQPSRIEGSREYSGPPSPGAVRWREPEYSTSFAPFVLWFVER